MRINQLKELRGASLIFLLAVAFAGLVNIYLLVQLRQTQTLNFYNQVSILANLINNLDANEENFHLLARGFGLERLVITDSLGNFIYDTFRQQGIFSEIYNIDRTRLKNGELIRQGNGFVSLIYDRTGNTKYAFIYPDLTLYKSIDRVARWQLIYFTISLIFIAVIGFILILRVLRPIHSVMDRITNLGITVKEDDFLRQSFDEMFTRLKKKEEEIQRLASLIAHEFRNSLATITGIVRARPIKRNRIALIEKECREMEYLIKHIIDFTRPLKLSTSSININNLIEDLIADFRLPERVKFRKSLNPDLKETKGDWEFLTRALANIIKNAIEARPREYITITTRNQNRFVVIEINDDGVGIPADKLKNVGEPFFSSKERGIGLGLAFVQKIVNLHNGQFEIESQEGIGTTVRIRLPL